MHPDKLKLFKNRLEDIAAALRAGIADASGQTDVVKLDGTMGRLSRMDAMQSQAMALALKQRQEQQLMRVESALQRLAAGNYGTCGRCNGAISEERLEAQPDAVLCVKCAARPKL
jgi:DnaK suppressor protein